MSDCIHDLHQISDLPSRLNYPSISVCYEPMTKVIGKFCDKPSNAKQNSAKWLSWMSSNNNNIIDI
jgi:hypothetical protein